jgi:hypothetical protein
LASFLCPSRRAFAKAALVDKSYKRVLLVQNIKNNVITNPAWYLASARSAGAQYTALASFSRKLRASFAKGRFG